MIFREQMCSTSFRLDSGYMNELINYDTYSQNAGIGTAHVWQCCRDRASHSNGWCRWSPLWHAVPSSGRLNRVRLTASAANSLCDATMSGPFRASPQTQELCNYEEPVLIMSSNIPHNTQLCIATVIFATIGLVNSIVNRFAVFFMFTPFIWAVINCRLLRRTVSPTCRRCVTCIWTTIGSRNCRKIRSAVWIVCRVCKCSLVPDGYSMLIIMFLFFCSYLQNNDIYHLNKESLFGLGGLKRLWVLCDRIRSPVC